MHINNQSNRMFKRLIFDNREKINMNGNNVRICNSLFKTRLLINS